MLKPLFVTILLLLLNDWLPFAISLSSSPGTPGKIITSNCVQINAIKQLTTPNWLKLARNEAGKLNARQIDQNPFGKINVIAIVVFRRSLALYWLLDGR